MTCPTPRKRRFRDRISAALFAARDAAAAGRDRTTVPYLCPCGSWHVKSRKSRTEKP